MRLVTAAFKTSDYALGQLGSRLAVKTTDTTGSRRVSSDLNLTATDAALNELAKERVDHETYTVTLDDQNSGVVTRDVTVTITGTDAAPVTGVARLTGSVTEGAQGHEPAARPRPARSVHGCRPDRRASGLGGVQSTDYALGQLGSLTAVRPRTRPARAPVRSDLTFTAMMRRSTSWRRGRRTRDLHRHAR